MDWLDSYLDNLSDGRNAVYPPDKNTWTPVKPSRQQQSMIQDSMAFDVQQMRLIQEARQELEAHGMSHADVADGIGADPGSPAKQQSSTPTPTPTPAADSFPFPQTLVVSEGVDTPIYGNSPGGIYRRLQAGDRIAQEKFPNSAGLTVSGSGYAYTRIKPAPVSSGAPFFYCIVGPDVTLRVGSTSEVAYQSPGPYQPWNLLIFSGYDVYGNRIINTEYSVLSASDGGIPRYWNSDSRNYPSMQNPYNRSALAMSLTAENASFYAPLSTQTLTSFGVKWYGSGALPASYDDVVAFMNNCQPLTAAGNLTWNGVKPTVNKPSGITTVSLTYENASVPYWRMWYKWSGGATKYTLANNYATSAFGIPLSGWSPWWNSVGPGSNRNSDVFGYLVLSGNG